MYRHILVPVDDSRLSIETASRAVAFAKTTGARITFFHARPDFGATDAGALVRVMAPEEFADQALGNARAVLAKAEADARASNVAHESVAKTTDRPYEGIIDTARERGCDLTFMASHKRRGFKKLFLGSQTQEVLAHTTPECQEHFTSEDWQEIARAFDKNGDPRFDKEREVGFEKMFSRIMNLAEHAG